MTQAIPPSSAASALSAPTPAVSVGAAATSVASTAVATPHAMTPTAAASPIAATSATAAATPTAQVASIVAAAQAALADTVNLSPQAQQAVKMQAFQQLVTNLVSQLQPASVALPSNWPAGGVTPQLQALVTQLLQQATAGQPLPQQLVSVQSWPSVLTQAVLQHAGHNVAAQATPTAPAAAGAAGAAAPSTLQSPLPALQNWLVQQGVVQAADGERAFTLTLRVPVAWAQAQAALSAALPKAASDVPTPAPASAGAAMPSGPVAATASSALPLGTSLQLPFTGSVQQLASGAMGLVMQPQVLPGSPAAAAAQAMRTSAILQLEFQPLAQAVQSAQAASVYMPAHLMPQDVQAMLQGKGTDPWLLLAQAHASGQAHKQAKNGNEHNQHFCNRAGCQYQGRAMCAQPFCAEMNYLWSVDRAQRRPL